MAGGTKAQRGFKLSSSSRTGIETPRFMHASLTTVRTVRQSIRYWDFHHAESELTTRQAGDIARARKRGLNFLYIREWMKDGQRRSKGVRDAISKR